MDGGGVGFYTIPRTSSADLMGSWGLECEGTRPLARSSSSSSGSAAQKGVWLWQDRSSAEAALQGATQRGTRVSRGRFLQWEGGWGAGGPCSSFQRRVRAALSAFPARDHAPGLFKFLGKSLVLLSARCSPKANGLPSGSCQVTGDKQPFILDGRAPKGGAGEPPTMALQVQGQADEMAGPGLGAGPVSPGERPQ